MKREKACPMLVMTVLLLISLPTGIQAQDKAAPATEVPLKNGVAASGDISSHASGLQNIDITRIAYFPSKSLAGLSGFTGMNASLAAARFNAQQAPTPAASRGKRSKKLIIIGAGLLGGGAALMLAGPTSTSSSPYTTSYNTKIYGGVIAASGGVALWQGLKRVH
ncbi:MAG: hypothetical protein JXA73_05045 [Acidobacteria bacterium]|nr:hypothetical protein [Acidobacteriota bacterium]